ncbi:MAG: HPP family protein [Oligoflexia bacterium]
MEKIAADWMSKRLVTVGADDPLSKCLELMRDNRIRHLPVLDRLGSVIGILSDRDLQRALVRLGDEPEIIRDESTYEFKEGETAQDYMSWPVETVSDDVPIQTVATRMLRTKVSALLVKNERGHINGILTTDDLLKMLVNILRRQPEGATATLRSIESWISETHTETGAST